jgi:hypothetical protein
VVRPLPVSAEERRLLFVRWRVDDRDEEAVGGEQRARAHQEVPGAPAQPTVRADLEPAVAAREEDDRRLRRRRSEHEEPLVDAGPRRDVDDALGLRPG